MRRQVMLLVMAMAGALIVAGGVAYAATITCDGAGDRDPDSGECRGTRNPDLISGTINSDVIRALAGNDDVIGRGGNDEIYLDEGNDIVDGLGDNDTIYGGPDSDGSANGKGFENLNLEGSEGSDTVYGGPGRDWIDAAQNDFFESVDSSFGEGGNDRINAVDGNVDIIDCGEGTRDRAFVDSLDEDVTGCERVTARVE